MRFINIVFAIIGLIAATVLPAAAGIEYQTVDGGTKEAKSGAPTVIAYLLNCESEGAPSQGSAFASHGTVTYKETIRKFCGKDHWPALTAIYTSNPGFTGTDEVTVYSGRAPFHFKIIVH